MKKITVAVVGCGRIANGAHLPALNEMEDVRLKYVCDIVKEKAEKAGAIQPSSFSRNAKYLKTRKRSGLSLLTPMTRRCP